MCYLSHPAANNNKKNNQNKKQKQINHNMTAWKYKYKLNKYLVQREHTKHQDTKPKTDTMNMTEMAVR